jgi:vacuolar-type H+-ATPase subunit H
MENFQIEKFNPLKAELAKLVENCKSVVINGINDKTGYELADESRKILKKKRCEIVKIFEAEREFSNNYSKQVMSLQKEMVGIIEPLERELENKQKAVDDEKEKIKRLESLPDRRLLLQEVEFEATDEFILSMDDMKFKEFYMQTKAEYLEMKEIKLQREKEEMEAEKQRKEKEEADRKEAEKAEKKRLADLEEARKQAIKDAEAKAKKDKEDALRKAEEEKKKAIQEEKKRAEEERARLIADQAKKEQDRIKAENEAKRLEAEKIAKEKEEAEKLEKRKKYVKFLTSNGYTEKTKDNFKVERINNKFILFKKVGEITI